jgi:hypothetical protein
MVFLGFSLPVFLIIYQLGFGSLYKIDDLEFENGYNRDDLKHIFITEKTLMVQAIECCTHNLGFIILSIVIGIVFGILAHLLLKRQKTGNNIKQ